MATDSVSASRECLQNRAIFRFKDLNGSGLHRSSLRRLEEAGQIEQIARGIYRNTRADITTHHSLAVASTLVHRGIVCLLSALRFHELTTQAPFEVWMAIDHKAYRPADLAIPLRVVWFSGEAFTSGVEEYVVEGVPVRVYCLAKTVTDCFKYRNKIGLDVALEALRECRREGRCSMDELWHYARICRVANVMRPYLEALAET
ncbi:type IV toxin-antitoxin system AbiEi family antitoxin domain-containing protein [Gloeobacter violaceus]|uniref:Glr2661 protein n=1 Tax=Gloeobacter violaceus (strain ATCC 29082 / PCC 7421) TaxID=251221 RepID=Q7NH76_GLOVI|nr:type IV toxin-antitoxin system AbiEi family antitoxin domain-containing protein [Gloeobacter violaceus]BAC90602.1 glr2661 [Gloeobacter violaceus PCC 7421]